MEKTADMSSLNRTTLVTGAATGLGRVVAAALTQAGAKVAVSEKPCTSLGETTALCADCGHRCFAVGMDVRNLDQICESVAAVEFEFGPVDILVNNAGISRPAPDLEVDQENRDDLIVLV